MYGLFGPFTPWSSPIIKEGTQRLFPTLHCSETNLAWHDFSVSHLLFYMIGTNEIKAGMACISKPNSIYSFLHSWYIYLYMQFIYGIYDDWRVTSTEDCHIISHFCKNIYISCSLGCTRLRLELHYISFLCSSRASLCLCSPTSSSPPTSARRLPRQTRPRRRICKVSNRMLLMLPIFTCPNQSSLPLCSSAFAGCFYIFLLEFLSFLVRLLRINTWRFLEPQVLPPSH
jgi:hypothetical protein